MTSRITRSNSTSSARCRPSNPSPATSTLKPDSLSPFFRNFAVFTSSSITRVLIPTLFAVIAAAGIRVNGRHQVPGAMLGCGIAPRPLTQVNPERSTRNRNTTLDARPMVPAESRICHLYEMPRMWLQDEGTGKVVLNVREADGNLRAPGRPQRGGPVLIFSPELWFLEKIGRGEDLNLRSLGPEPDSATWCWWKLRNTEIGSTKYRPPFASQCLTCYCVISNTAP